MKKKELTIEEKLEQALVPAIAMLKGLAGQDIYKTDNKDEMVQKNA